MQKNKIETLEHFINRTGMHIVPITELSIISWIHGFEEGSGTNIFTKSLKEHLEVTFEIYGGCLGWPRHIRLYSEKSKTDWNNAFFEIAKIIVDKLKDN